MKARKKGGDPIKKMTPKSDKQGIASANMKEDKMNVARRALYTSTTEKEVLDKLERGFASIKPDSALRGGSSRKLLIIDPRNVDESTARQRRISELEDADASKKFQATLNKKGDPIKKKK